MNNIDDKRQVFTKNRLIMKKEHTLSMAFYHAFKGLQNFFLQERNGKIQLLVACTIVAAAFAFKISPIEWVIVLLCIGLVLALEMINSAIEKLCDLVHRDFHPVIKIVKDVSAAGVLWVSIVSTTIGCIIFIPKIIALL
jgi:undecaprenol kinase/diacylglycerol kinase (ATP)